MELILQQLQQLQKNITIKLKDLQQFIYQKKNMKNLIKTYKLQKLSKDLNIKLNVTYIENITKALDDFYKVTNI